MPELSIRHGDSNSNSESAYDDDEDDSVNSTFLFVYDLNVDMYVNNDDVNELILPNISMVDPGAHFLTAAMDTASEENTNEHGNECGCEINSDENSNTINPDVSFFVLVDLQNLFVNLLGLLIVIVMIVIVEIIFLLLTTRMKM